ncbi:MAG: hypothetical protein IJ789_04745 [Bacteroidales bacterium]|nr:hypothetical protein [Bacteroidales bacterium]MBR1850664.1 hypothetical protein [Bacteroidales bacterium]
MDTIEYWKREWNNITDITPVTQISHHLDTSLPKDIPDGRYYNIDGFYLGDTRSWDGKKVFIADSVEKDDYEHVIGAYNIKELNQNYITLRQMASTIYGESSAVYMNKMTEELKCEMFAIAEVHLNNDKAYADKSAKAQEYRRLLPLQINKSPFKRIANAAVIKALIDKGNFSHNAKQWDGAEQAMYDTDELRVMHGGTHIILHMNTQGWRISDEHYAKWKANIGAGFKAPQVKAAVMGDNKGKILLTSVAVYCKTIFWAYTNEEQ